MPDKETRRLDELVIDPSLDPRSGERSQEKIQEYAANIDSFPPIDIDQDNRILDGVHRYHAHKLAGREEIAVEVFTIESDTDAVKHAIRSNVTHGVPLTQADLKRMAIKLWKVGASNQEIAKTISRSIATVITYLKEVKTHRKNEAKKLALNLSDQGYTQTKIAEVIKERLNYKVDQTTVSAWRREHAMEQKEPEIEPEEVEREPATDAGSTFEPELQRYSDEKADVDEDDEEKDEETERIHSEMQWMLLWLGNELKLKFWLPKKDFTESHKKNEIADLAGRLEDLPFDILKAGRPIQRIDVLWLKDNKIIAAFEIENSTGIESGLLRMSHMWVSLEDPNIRTHIVAQDNDVNKAGDKISEPTFKHNGLTESCRFIPYTKLTNKYNEAEQNGSIPYDWQELLDEISYKL